MDSNQPGHGELTHIPVNPNAPLDPYPDSASMKSADLSPLHTSTNGDLPCPLPPPDPLPSKHPDLSASSSELPNQPSHGKLDHVPVDPDALLDPSPDSTSMNSADLPASNTSTNGDLPRPLPPPAPLPSMHSDLSAASESTSMHSVYVPPSHNSDVDLHRALPVTDVPASKHYDLSAEIKKSFADNQIIPDEIRSFSDVRAAMHHTEQYFKRELQESSERVAVLSSAIASLEAEKRKQEKLVASMEDKLHGIHAEKMDLQVENEDIASEAQSLNEMLAETSDKSALLQSDIDEKQMALADAHNRIHMACFELEKLQREKEEYSREAALLEARNHISNEQVSQMKEEEKALSDEIDRVVAAKDLAEQKVSDTQASISAVNEQFSAITDIDEDMQNKLCELNESLRQLEQQERAIFLRESELERNTLALESAMQANFDTTEQDPEQEKVSTAGHPCVLEVNAATDERGVHVSESKTEVQETCDSTRQQHIEDLDCQVAESLEQKEVVASSVVESQPEMEKKRVEKEAETFAQVKENIKSLESTVKEAEEEADCLESDKTQVKCELQELTILARRKRFAGWTTPLMVSGGTVVALGVLVYLLRSNSKAK